MASYRDLVAWKKSMRLALSLYAATDKFPREEMYGLRQQLRRAAVSVPSNIAEGQARYSHREFLRFIGLARGSLVEAETQIYLARALGYMDRKTAKDLLIASEEVGRIINGLRESLQKKLQAKISQDR